MLEESQQVVELYENKARKSQRGVGGRGHARGQESWLLTAVDVPDDLDGRLELEQRGLVNEDRRRLLDQVADLVRRQVHHRAGLFCG